MISDTQNYPSNLYPTLNPPSVSETLGENPTMVRNQSEGRERKGSFNESEEIQSKSSVSFLTFKNLLMSNFLFCTL